MAKTKEKIDLQKWDQRLESAKKDLQESKKVSNRNKKLILEFVNFKKNSRQIGSARQCKYIQNLNVLAETLGKDLDKAKRRDIEQLVEKIYSWEHALWTKRVYLQILQTFYNWRKKNNPVIEWLEIPKPKTKKVRPNEIITWRDAVKLSQHATNPRDKCLPQVLWESGCRISELLTLKFEDVEEVETTNGGAVFILHLRESKTDIREVAIPESSPALAEWMSYHPKKEGFLFVNFRDNNKIMTDAMARKVLRDLGDRAGITKPLNPHNFRKSSATIYAGEGVLSELELKKRFGWTADSRMLNIYVHLDDKKVNEKLLREKGLLPTQEEEQEKKNQPIKCRWCSEMNAAGNRRCHKCKQPLQEKEIKLKSRLDRDIEDVADYLWTKKRDELKKEIMQEMNLKGKA